MPSEAESTGLQLAQVVARRMMALIEAKALAPGGFLGREVDLGWQFGVSRPTLRAAIRLLEISGQVSTRPGIRGGVFVAVPATSPVVSLLTRHIVALGQTLPVFLSVYLPFFAYAADLAASRASPRQRGHLANLIAEMLAAENTLAAFRPLRLELRIRLLEATGLSSLQLVGEALMRAYVRNLDGELRLGATETGKVRAVKMAEAGFIAPLIKGDRYGTSAAFAAAAQLERTVTAQTIDAGMVPETSIPRTLFAALPETAGAMRLAEHVERAIRRDMHFSHPAGTWMGSVGDISARYGVSQEICREALGLLSLHGLVDVRRGHGGGVFAARSSLNRMRRLIISGLREGSGLPELAALLAEIRDTCPRGISDHNDLATTLEFLDELIGCIETAMASGCGTDYDEAPDNRCGPRR